MSPTFREGLWTGQGDRPTVALSVDDGPHPHYTPQLLEVLAAEQVRASFFWLGQWVTRYPTVAQAVFQQGHWLGLHGYTHRSFPRLSDRNLRHSLERTQQAIAQACHLSEEAVRSRVRDVRPPNGLFVPGMLRKLRQWGYRPVMWTVVPEDWVNPGVEVCIQRVMAQTRPGAIIVLHDGLYGGENVAAIAQGVIARLKDRGYQFVTIDDYWQSRHPLPPMPKLL